MKTVHWLIPAVCACALGSLTLAAPARADRPADRDPDDRGYSQPQDRRDDPRDDDYRRDDPRRADAPRDDVRRDEARDTPRDRLFERAVRLQVRLEDAAREERTVPPELRTLQTRVERLRSFLRTHPVVTREDFTRQDRELRDVSGAFRAHFGPAGGPNDRRDPRDDPRADPRDRDRDPRDGGRDPRDQDERYRRADPRDQDPRDRDGNRDPRDQDPRDRDPRDRDNDNAPRDRN